jgi:hypothetical protein
VKNVTLLARSLRGAPPLFTHTLHIVGLKGLLGAMKQDPKIVPIHSKIAANVIFVALFQKHFFQKAPVPFAEIVKDVPDGVRRLSCHDAT